MANIDRALNIYQSYSLAKISALNKKSLAMQYAQCEEINKLEKSISRELQVVNKLNRQILENQLKDIKHKETIKFYRKIAFDAKEAIELIDSQDNVMFKCFICEIYAKPLGLLLEDAKNNLEEISDKEYCSVWIKKLDSITTDYLSFAKEYESSDYKVILSTKDNYNASIEFYNNEIKRIENERSSIQEYIPEFPKSEKEYNRKGCLILTFIVVLFSIFGLVNSKDDDIITGIELLVVSLIIFSFFFWRFFSRKKKYMSYVETINRQNHENEKIRMIKIRNLDEQINNLLKQLNEIKYSHPHNISRNNIKISNPNFEYIINKIEKFLPKEKEEIQEREFDDPIYEEIKKYVIISGVASISNIQRKFALGYKRAYNIMEKLEEEGIIGPSCGDKARIVLISS